MRFVNAGGRAALLAGDQVFDVESASGRALPADPHRCLVERWEELLALAAEGAHAGGVPVSSTWLGPPVPTPPVVLSVVANYPPTERARFPMVVGKSPTSVCGPVDDIVLPNASRLPLGEAWVIPEPELGVVTCRAGRHLSVDAAADAIAGYVVAQDVTERRHEFGPSRGPWEWSDLPAKTLGKSFDTFCPIGPALVTPEELQDVDTLVKKCWLNGDLRFEQSCGEMLWSPPQLVALVSAFMTLPAGALLLTGCGPTVDGSPIPFLAPGDEIRTEIDGIGTMVNRCVSEA